MADLQSLNVQYNNLEGVPLEIAAARNLRFLDLYVKAFRRVATVFVSVVVTAACNGARTCATRHSMLAALRLQVL